MAQDASLYEDDFYAWTVEQARLLRAGELSAIDAANIAKEIESMGRSDRRELQSRLVVLTMHLLTRRFQPAARSRSCSATSLRPVLAAALPQAYSQARENAADETGFAATEFPAECPFTLDEVLSRAFLPEP